MFVARDLSASKLAGDEAFEIRVRTVPFTSFSDLIRANDLHDAGTIAALFLTQAYLAQKKK